jgi:hypothetical protein
MKAEKAIAGWFTDPYERHQERWMSVGTPSSLVRDREVVGSDPVASGPFRVNPVRSEGHVKDGSDRLRANDAERDGLLIKSA